MKTFAEAIRGAELVTTKKEKLNALRGLDKPALRLIEMALDPYRQFYIKQIDGPETFAETDLTDDFQYFIWVLDCLSSRTITGNAARSLVNKTLGLYTRETAEYLKRVVFKNLDCGATITTFKKIYPFMNVREFNVMLASKLEPGYKWTFPCIVSQKLDGNRLIAVVKQGGTVEYFSRSGKPAGHCDGLFDAELLQIARDFNYDLVVDGEVLGDSFQETMTSRGFDNVDAKNRLKFYLFDMMALSQWTLQSCKIDQHARLKQLDKLITDDMKTVQRHRWSIASTIEEAHAYYEQILKLGVDPDGTLNGQGEGLIIKEINGLYEFKRSKNWVKWKPVIDVDLQITGFYEGTGRLCGTLGGIQLHGFDENQKEIRCDCGSGFDDETRAMFWLNRDSLLLKTVQLECQEICRATDSEYYSLRFPVFKRIRTDK